MCSTVSERAVTKAHSGDFKHIQLITICDIVVIATDGCGGAVVGVAVATVLVVGGDEGSTIKETRTKISQGARERGRVVCSLINSVADRRSFKSFT